MALKGKENTVSALRASKMVYWRIFEDARTKTAGSFISSADFENPNLAETQSYDDLYAALQRLTPGRYVLLAYRKNETKGGANFESAFEVESNGSNAVISGVNDTASFYLEGIGKVTSENFEEAIDKKLSMKLAAMDKEKEDKALRDRVKQLEAEVKDNEGAVNRGLMAVGTVLYGQLSKTPAFKEMIGVIGDVTKAANNQQPVAEHLGSTAVKELPANHIDGEDAEIGGTKVNQDELYSTLDDLGKDNPDVLQHLKILAKLKKDNPAMYSQAVDMAGSL